MTTNNYESKTLPLIGKLICVIASFGSFSMAVLVATFAFLSFGWRSHAVLAVIVIALLLLIIFLRCAFSMMNREGHIYESITGRIRTLSWGRFMLSVIVTAIGPLFISLLLVSGDDPRLAIVIMSAWAFLALVAAWLYFGHRNKLRR